MNLRIKKLVKLKKKKTPDREKKREKERKRERERERETPARHTSAVDLLTLILFNRS